MKCCSFFGKRFFSVIMLLPIALVASAEPISRAEAFNIAKTFLTPRHSSARHSAIRLTQAKLTTETSAAQSAYYVFNVSDEDGFVIVSGDDSTPAILGYADSGHIDMDALPDALRYMLDGYAEQIAWLQTHPQSVNAQARAESQADVRSRISPLIVTRWNQGSPYNNNCPLVETEHTVTGCVATSMAQLMFYHKWPERATSAISGYTTKTKKFELEGLEPTTFDWDAMTHTYSSNSTGAAADAVAKLMQYCGWALQMNYDVSAAGGSSAYNASIPWVLTNCFDYDSGIRYARREYYSYQEWVNLIYQELAANRPVIMGGQSAGGGHSFVCDGYDTDDFFHLNWGWSGSSDGYFRLSILNPAEQGIGGSSTVDGFSYGQDAILGIQPPRSQTDDSGYCLSLEGFRFGSNDTRSSASFDREKAEDAFTGISLYVTLCSYQFGSNAFDYAVQLTDGDGNVVHTLHEANNKSCAFNNDLNESLSDLSIPASVSDGTYYIKVVSKEHGTETWQECYAGDRFQMTAIINGNSLTITAPIPAVSLPELVNLQVIGDCVMGHEQEVIVSLTGGKIDFHHNLILYSKGEKEQMIAGKQADIPASRTVDVHFFYTPTAAGTDKLIIKANGTKIGGEYSVTITESDATDNLDLGFNVTVNNLTAGRQLYGHAFRATVSVTNTSETNSYAGRLNCSIREWKADDDFESLNVISKPLIVAKKTGDTDGVTTLTFAYDGLKKDKHYSFRFTYTKDGNTTDAVHWGYDVENKIGTITTTDGYRIGDATGATTIHPSSENIDAGTACFVDLRDVASFEGLTVTPSTNPNCLYFLASDASVPTALTGHNVVKGNQSENIVLQDGNDFFSPLSFTAQTISYKRTFTLAAGGNEGWNSLLVPFDVSTITCEGIGTVDWFRGAEDTGKNFWLRAFTADESGTVTFSDTQTLAANTPYIIAVPDSRFGESLQMTGREVTFSATDATVAATGDASVSGDYFKFCGTTAGRSLTNVYKLNAAGSRFVKRENSSVGAFRVWFSPVSISSLSLSSLSIASPELTGILPVSLSDIGSPAAGWYTLDGRRLAAKPAAPGLFIHNGKKQVIR